jgi:hypothetical protein
MITPLWQRKRRTPERRLRTLTGRCQANRQWLDCRRLQVAQLIDEQVAGMRAFVPYRSCRMMAAAILGGRIALLLINRLTRFGRLLKALGDRISRLPQKLGSSKARHRSVRSRCILNSATKF